MLPTDRIVVAGVEEEIGYAGWKPGLLWPLSQLALNLDL